MRYQFVDSSQNGSRLAGTGVVGFTALRALGGDTRLIVSDFASAMVEALELPDESVDGVLCRWGYMLLAEPRKGAR